MEAVEIGREKRSYVLLKKLESYLSMKTRRRRNIKGIRKTEVAPTGCFSVYVGPAKQRFVMKAEYANHPLFRMLLEDAEMEYGFRNDGPLLLPCDVDLFCKVLGEILDDRPKSNDDDGPSPTSCGFVYGSCSPSFNPARRLGKSSTMAKGFTSYGLLTTHTLLDI